MADPISAAVGLAVAPHALLQAATALYDHISAFRHNPRLKLRVLALVHDLITTLQSAPTASQAASALTHQELESVRESLQPRHPTRCRYYVFKHIRRCITTSAEYAKLKEAERKLESLRTQVVVVENMLHLVSTICNGSVELPYSQIGLDRDASSLKFLQKSESEELRVIAIHGQPGIGKTTILNKVWQETSSKAPFGARAYVQIGHDATSESIICKLQSSIVWQLVGQTKEFPSSDIGKGEMENIFQDLKVKSKPLFLAIDNVYEAQDLRDLLSNKLAMGTSLPYLKLYSSDM